MTKKPLGNAACGPVPKRCPVFLFRLPPTPLLQQQAPKIQACRFDVWRRFEQRAELNLRLGKTSTIQVEETQVVAGSRMQGPQLDSLDVGRLRLSFQFRPRLHGVGLRGSLD